MSEGDKITRKYHQDFSCNNNNKLVIENKYGQVNIQNWKNDAVSVDVVVSAETGNKEKADKILDKIKIRFSTADNLLKAITTIDGEFGKINFSIDYTVKMPVYLSLDISNKFGNVIIEEADNLVNLNVEYGDLNAKKLLYNESKPMSEIRLSYSNGTIGQCNWAKVILKYSDMKVITAKALVLVSRFSQFNQENGNSLICDSKYDTYELGAITNFVFSGEFTNSKIKKLGKKADIDMKYGSLDVNEVTTGFESIDIKNRFGSIDCIIPENASYRVNAVMKYCDLDLRESKNLNVTNSGSRKTITGMTGSNSNPTSEVKVTSEYGDVKLR